MTTPNQFCDCEQDGFCVRYQREMSGRFRAICQGDNVDLGTAAAFREQWAREACPARPLECVPTPPKPASALPIILQTAQAPGDAVAMTAAIYSLHRAHPGKYLTAVDSPWPEIFAHNPDVTPVAPADASLLRMHYPAISDSNKRGIHFMQGWCEHLGYALGVNVPLLTNRPHLYFNSYDLTSSIENFWIICSGGKRDFTNKLWGQHNYQAVVDKLDHILFVQVGAGSDDHPRLKGACDFVGKTTLRQLFTLVRRSRGVICGVSLLMHVAAALEKPAIVIAGGREPVQWNAYPKQRYLHTVGALPCTTPQGEAGGACWRGRVVPLGDGTEFDKDTCLYPVNSTPTRLTQCTIPKCMEMIHSKEVTELLLRYNRQYEGK